MLKILTRISLQDLTTELGFKDYRRTLSWLEKRRIPFKREGRGYYILKYNIDFSTFLEMAEDLRKRFPVNWFKIFEALVEDKSMVNAVFEVIPPNASSNASASKNNGHKFFK